MDGVWVYLHAGGAIGASGPVAGVEGAPVDALGRYVLECAQTGDELADSVRRSLKLTGLAPDRVIVPGYAAMARAALGHADLSLHFAGRTGSGKTAAGVLFRLTGAKTCGTGTGRPPRGH